MTVFDFEVPGPDGNPRPLSAYRGRTLLLVNVASRCGYTPQYAGLEALHRAYADRGFSVLAFPCNQFGAQEPGTNEDIQRFCATTYDVTFPVFGRIDVNGDSAHPLYQHLTAARRGILGTRGIKWNFTKFLVGPDGEVIRRYAPQVAPEAIAPDVAAHLPRPSGA